jgi:hypothetical protein
MSVDRHLYLGPYLECKDNPKIITKTVSHKGCLDETCREYRQGRSRTSKFCSTCGAKLGTFETKETEPAERTDPYEVLENAGLDGDALTDMRNDSDPEWENYLGVNNVSHGFWLDDCDGVHQDRRNLDIKGEMAWFEETYAKEIAALKQVYQIVEVKWGLHQYFN